MFIVETKLEFYSNNVFTHVLPCISHVRPGTPPVEWHRHSTERRSHVRLENVILTLGSTERRSHIGFILSDQAQVGGPTLRREPSVLECVLNNGINH